MSATSSSLPDRPAVLGDPSGRPGGRPRVDWLFLGWVVFAVDNLAIMVLLPDVGAIAFHLIWISTSIVYGVQGWSGRRTAVILAIVTLTSGLGMASFVVDGHAEWTELTEVPLMAAVFAVMVWHVRRRARALADSEAAATRERRSNELKELFVRNCSHEMRTPITVARGYTEMVRAEVSTPGAKQDLDVVLDELDKLGGLSSRLLRLADAYETSGFEYEPVELAALVRHTVQRWRPTAERHWVVETAPVVVDADESRLESALDSLIENALKFTDPGDEIAVRCRRSGGQAVLEVSDTGIGFAAAEGAATASPEDGAGPSTRRRGTGLGLAIVRAIAEGHGGTMDLADNTPCGARIRLTLPLTAPQSSAQSSAQTGESAAAHPGT